MSDKAQILDKLKQAVVDLKPDLAVEAAKEALEAGINPLEAIDNGLTPGINIIVQQFDDGDLFMPQILISAHAFMSACEILQGAMSQEEAKRSGLGKVLFFTVQGDIHDIGKNIVKTMFMANNFEVYDLGRDVAPEEVIKKAKELKVDIIAGSALMTTTMPGQRDIVALLKEEGIRDQFKVLFGGAPVTKAWCDDIGADDFGDNAAEAVRVARRLMGK
jgi:trimethylamine corrinoid protein